MGKCGEKLGELRKVKIEKKACKKKKEKQKGEEER